jgi:hypothetical protein
MTETRHLICEGTCNPQLRMLDEQRIAATLKWRPERVQMPSMPEGWVEVMREQRHTPLERKGAGYMGALWACRVCGTQRRW